MSAVVPFRTSTCLAKVSVLYGVWTIHMFGEDSVPLGTLGDITFTSAVVEYVRAMKRDRWRIVYRVRRQPHQDPH